MQQLERQVATKGKAWIGSPESDEYWCEGEDCEVEVERTDQDEIRVGIHLDPGGSEDAGFYVSNRQALSLLTALAKALDA
jgi:hypothetical protein